jgi:hypothetical protein
MDGPRGVFLSAVTSEFGRARQEIARSLGAKRFEVKVQEEFEQGGDTLLQKIDDYIRDCQAVVAIVGTRSGAFPQEAEAQEFAGVASAAGLEPGPYSYTEWELIFAHHYGRKLFLFLATPDYQPDRPTPEGDRPEIQARVVAWLRSQGREWSEFTDVRDLQIGVWMSKLDTVAGVRRSATTTDEGLDVVEAPRAIVRPRDPADANRLPANRHEIVGRERELEDLLAEVDGRFEQLVMVVGPAGIGKHALLNELSNSDGLPTDLANGAGIHPEYREADGLEDMQQAIWRQFYVADESSTVDPIRRRNDLQDLETLIVLPDIDSSAAHLPSLLASMPRSFFCISAQEDATRSLPGEEIPLDPLDDDATIALFEDRYRGQVADEVRAGVLRLCDGNPGRTELLAKEARKDARRRRGDDDPLASWVTDRLAEGTAASAPGTDAVATAMEATAAVGRQIPRDLLAEVCGSSTAIDEAVDDGRLEEGSPRYRLNPVLVPAGDDDEDAAGDGVMSAVFAQTMVWIVGATHSEIFENRSFVIRMMQWGTESAQRLVATGDPDSVERARRRFEEVITLGVGAESSMVLGGRHGAWDQLLDEVERAAEAVSVIERDAPSDDRGARTQDATTAAISGEEALGWVFHERGSRALLRDELDDARLHLNRSLRHRTTDAGRELTRKNLKLAPLAVLPFTALFVLVLLGGSLALVSGAPFDTTRPAIDISPDFAGFDADSPETFEIRNIGDPSIWIESFGIVDADGEKVEVSGGFEVVPGAEESQPCSEEQLIESGDFCTVTVRFTGEIRATELFGVDIVSRSGADAAGDESAVLFAGG